MFDPYAKWLGITDHNGTPNHFQLLGLSPDVDDPDIISNASDMRMAHVRTFQSGKNTKDSQRILNELSQARLCLLDPQRRAAYRESIAPKPVAAPVIHAPKIIARPAPRPKLEDSGIGLDFDLPRQPTVAPPIAIKQKRPKWELPKIKGLGLYLTMGITLVVIVGLCFALSRTGTPVLPPPPPPPEWVDVTAKLDPYKNAFSGKWNRVGGRLMSDVSPENRLLLPISVRGDKYDYELEINWERLSGSDCVNLCLPIKPHGATLVVNGWPWDGGTTYLTSINNLHAFQIPEAVKGHIIGERAKYLYYVRVIQDGSNATVSFSVNGTHIFSWSGNTNSLTSTFALFKVLKTGLRQ